MGEQVNETAQALAIVYVSTNEGETWSPVKPDMVPEFVKDPDVMANLLHGEMAQERGGLAWYRAEKIPAPTLETRQ